jgi:hypothetical protein
MNAARIVSPTKNKNAGRPSHGTFFHLRAEWFRHTSVTTWQQSRRISEVYLQLTLPQWVAPVIFAPTQVI